MVEKTPYTILEKIGDMEIRQYPKLILATVKNNDDDSAFGQLFNYISGENLKQEKIKMTAPVISSEKISMTAPVITKKNYMAFVMPSKYIKENIPAPKNSKVKIEVQEKRKIATLRFSGYATHKNTTKRIELLLEKLKTNELKTKGEPFLMRYNSPFAPGFLRRNEVGIEII